MTTPYREPTTTLVELRPGACPWCRASVRFDPTQPTATCEHCGARYAPSLAIVPTPAPATVVGSRLPYYAVLTCVGAAGVLLIPLAFAVVVLAAVFAAGIYLGFGAPRIPKPEPPKQLPPPG